ncbi:MAG: hypothetical protein DCC51_02290 [Anaerolineae bacterium]|nr:MAG: hypothetical protein DCC51_02290 [Anaerolineae bacterium]
MIQRILILTGYFVKNVFFSLTGLILLILSLAFWAILFPPGQGTPDIENYIILIGALGAAATFMTTLATSARAARMEHYPMLVRLPSRVEYLTAVFLSSLVLGLFMQLLVAGLALIRGPELSVSHLLMIPPIWLSIDLLAVILAMHATDLVTAGWSRVILFGLLALALVLNSASSSPESWFPERLDDLAELFSRVNLMWFSDLAYSASSWAYDSPLSGLTRFAGILFWPFRAMTDAVLAGGFTPSQALAPAVVMLYGAILFLIAATLFAGKDLEFLE